MRLQNWAWYCRHDIRCPTAAREMSGTAPGPLSDICGPDKCVRLRKPRRPLEDLKTNRLPRQTSRDILRSFHDGMQARVIDGNQEFAPFEVKNGVKQGCVLAPVLFGIIIDAMIKDAFKNCNLGVRVRHRHDGGLFNPRRLKARTKVSYALIRELLYADDCALACLSEEDASCWWTASLNRLFVSAWPSRSKRQRYYYNQSSGPFRQYQQWKSVRTSWRRWTSSVT